MIIPTAVDLLRCIEHTLETVVKPTLTDTAERSAAQTMGHLLRHAILKVEHEGQILMDEGVIVRELLSDIRGYIASLPSSKDSEQALAEIDVILKKRFRDENRYPTLMSMAEEAGALRECLYGSLKFLQAIRSEHGEEPEYTHLRNTIRNYMAKQIESEAELIEPAFVGFGPRR